MIGEKINDLMNKKSFLIFASIVVSVILWLYVTYSDNSQQTNTVSGIKINYIGQEDLRENNLLITDTDRETLMLKFSGRRNNIALLNSQNVSVTVDLSQIVKNGTGSGVYQLKYDINYPSKVSTTFLSIVDSSADYITVTVEELVTVDVPVQVVINGNIASGYQAEPTEVYPKTVEISGTNALVSKVVGATAVVDIKDLNRTYDEEIPITLVGKNGVAVDDTDIAKNHEMVRVKIPVIMVKEIPLNLSYVYTNAITAENFDEYVSVSITPPVLTLSGDVDSLKNFSGINVGTIDLSKFASSTKEIFNIEVPESFTNITGVTTATVTVTVSGLESKGFSTPNISLENETDGYFTKIEVLNMYIMLRGRTSSLNTIKSGNIRVVADLSELGQTTGTYSVPAKVYIDGYKNVDAVGEYYVTVTISKTDPNIENLIDDDDME